MTKDYRVRFLIALGAVGVSLVIAEKIVPRSGFLIACGVGLFWLIQSGAFTWLTRALDNVRRGVIVGNVGQ